MPRLLPVLAISALLVSMFFVSAPVFATAPVPTYGTAAVDGDASEWNLVTDYFADMYRAGNPLFKVEAKAYMRYDCVNSILYVLVLGEGGVPLLAEPAATSWIAIGNQSNKVVDGNSGDDGVAPDFQWVNLAPAPGDTLADGYEASFSIQPGNYDIIVHTDVFDDAKAQTAATEGFPMTGIPLVLDCSVPVKATTWGRIKHLNQ